MQNCATLECTPLGDGSLLPIALDVPKRSLELRISEEELSNRRAAWQPAEPHYRRGFGAMHAQSTTQADKGCDFGFLVGRGGVPEPEIH